MEMIRESETSVRDNRHIKGYHQEEPYWHDNSGNPDIKAGEQFLREVILWYVDKFKSLDFFIGRSLSKLCNDGIVMNSYGGQSIYHVVILNNVRASSVYESLVRKSETDDSARVVLEHLNDLVSDGSYIPFIKDTAMYGL